jgi:simple sugar transport system permease protein
MMLDIASLGQIAVKSSIAVLFAALGETMAERSGVLNLGVEGMMLVGCLAGFAVGAATGDAGAGMLAAALAGAALAGLHALFAINLGANQMLSGLAIALLGQGLSTVVGRAYLTSSGVRITPYAAPFLSDIPLLGKILFVQPWPAYVAYALAPALWFVLWRTRLGLWTRATGEDAEAADASGAPALRLRWLWTLFGGLMAGAGGGYLSLAYTPGFKESMSAGQGWIALAMAIFATWNPLRVFWAALFFGVLAAAQFASQIGGESLAPAWLLRALPYLLTIAALTLSGLARGARRSNATPAALGTAFFRP